METSAGDIIFFATVAVFIIHKLYSTLGRKPDNDEVNRINKLLKSQNKYAKVEKLVEANDQEKKQIEEPEIGDSKLIKKINEIKVVDKTFSAGSFLEGAKAAFEMVVNAFSAGDKKTLKNLLTHELYKAFSDEIDKSEKSNKRMETTLVSIVSTDIISISIKKNGTKIEVEFISEQIQVSKDKEGKVIGGNSSEINKVKDLWLFERDIKSSDPNWKIIAT